MQFTRHGARRENIVESIRPLEKVEDFILRRLNCLFEYVLVYHPGIYYKYIERLDQDICRLLIDDYSDFKIESLEKLVLNYPAIRNQISLLAKEVGFYAQYLEIDQDVFNKNEPIEVSLAAFTKSVVFAEYHWIETLSSIIGKEKAAIAYRGAIERYCLKYSAPTIPRYDTLEEMRERWLKFIDSGALGRIRVASNVENGVWILRCDNCEKVESLGDISHLDRDILKAVQCSADFQVTRFYNENFVMTRTQTIANGDPYCDWVFHDIRYDKNLEHPSEEFMDSIWPLYTGER